MRKKIKFKKFSTIGKEEFKAVKDVLKSGVLSGFVAGYPNGFNGGKYNQLFDKYPLRKLHFFLLLLFLLFFEFFTP